jgi:hypothetical protein
MSYLIFPLFGGLPDKRHKLSQGAGDEGNH